MSNDTTYNQESKIKVRRDALKHAVEILTARRNDAAVVPRDHVQKVLDFMRTKSTSYDKQASQHLDSTSISSWEKFWNFQTGTRHASDLTVAYLAGPEPLNDFRELTKLGIQQYNIFAFESDNKVYNRALKQVRQSEFPFLKLQRGSIDQYIRNVPRNFDIIYVDACGPLPSRGQRTVSTIFDIFRYNRLNSPGVLITNFATPDLKDQVQNNSYSEMVTGYLYPKGMLENPGVEDWNLTDGAMAYGKLPRNDTDQKDSFFHDVQGDFGNYYGQFITRHLFDIASFISPWMGFSNSENWKNLFTQSPQNIAKLSSDFGFATTSDISSLVSDPDMFPIGWAMLSLSPNAENSADFLAPSPNSGKLHSSWLAQLGGAPKTKVTALECMAAYSVLRSEEAAHGLAVEQFHQLLDQYNYMGTMHLFCDVPNRELALLPLIAQFSRPMHYNVTETKRFSYVAEGKETEMFTDVIPFDACRYIYDWLPPVDLTVDSFDAEPHQLVYRFALDGLVKHTIRYNNDYLYGLHVAGVNHRGFTEKLLKPRRRM